MVSVPLFRYRYRVLVAVLALFLLLYVVKHSAVVCDDTPVLAVLEQLCGDYREGLVTGSLCDELCGREEAVVGCVPAHSGKAVVFSTTLDHHTVFVKSAYPAAHPSPARDNHSGDLPPMSEDTFRKIVRQLVNEKLNVSVTHQQLDRLMQLGTRHKSGAGRRQLEMEQIYRLVQSQEYLLSVLYAEQDMFPYIHGTCGHLFAVEQLKPIEMDNHWFDGEVDWWDRLKISVLIMEYLEQLETEFPDPIRICDLKVEHFGLTPLGKLKYFDLDYVYTDNKVQGIVADGKHCKKDYDCDLVDCKGFCNHRTNKCDIGVSNNNLQVVCERIFLGWTMEGRLVVPGLLLTDYTPTALASLLRQCADTGRGPVPEDIRQTLHTTLTEMEQTASEKYT